MWGFTPEWWAALGFSKAGDRDRLLGLWQDDDWVLVLGTFGEEPADDDRGRLLGLVKIGRKALPTEQLVDPTRWHEQRFRRDGLPKWPHGIPMTEAWRFTARPLPDRRDVLPRLQDAGLGMALTGFVELNPEEAKAVLSLPRARLETLYRSHEMLEQSAREARTASLRATTGPAPSLVNQLREIADGPASIYLLRFVGDLRRVSRLSAAELGNKVLYKIGWSVNPANRLTQINAHFPDPAIAGWKLEKAQEFPSRLEAYFFEQKLLNTLSSYRMRGETVLMSEREMSRCWNEIVLAPNGLPLDITDDQVAADMERWL